MKFLRPKVIRKQPTPYGTVGLIILLCSGCASIPSDSGEMRENFPAKMAVAAFGQRHAPESIENLQLTPVTDLRCLIDASDIQQIDTNQLLAKIDQLDDRGPFTPEQAIEAARLIKTGQFFADIRSTVQVSAEFFPGIRERVRERIRVRMSNPRRPSCLPSEQSIDSGVSSKPFSALLACVYQNPLAGEVAQTANILLQNDSIRLATIVYARANGINLTNQDLDALRDHLLNTENPDLTALTQHGISRLKEQFGIDQVDQLIANIQEKRNLCEA